MSTQCPGVEGIGGVQDCDETLEALLHTSSDRQNHVRAPHNSEAAGSIPLAIGFTRRDLAALMARLSDREPHLRLVARPVGLPDGSTSRSSGERRDTGAHRARPYSPASVASGAKAWARA